MKALGLSGLLLSLSFQAVATLDPPLMVSVSCQEYVDSIGQALPIFQPLLFAPGQVELSPEQLPQLQCIAQVVAANNLTVSLASHTDRQGSAAGNMRLSQQRFCVGWKYMR